MISSMYTAEVHGCVTRIIATCLVTYGERLPHTEHHFLAEDVLDGPIAAVRYVGTSGGN